MKKIVVLGVLALSPLLTLAQGGGVFEGTSDFTGAKGKILALFNDVLIPLFFGLALVFFLWGVLVTFVISRDEDSRNDGKQYMIWAIGAMVVMVSVWGIVNLLSSALGLEEDNLDSVPKAGVSA